EGLQHVVSHGGEVALALDVLQTKASRPPEAQPVDPGEHPLDDRLASQGHTSETRAPASRLRPLELRFVDRELYEATLHPGRQALPFERACLTVGDPCCIQPRFILGIVGRLTEQLPCGTAQVPIGRQIKALPLVTMFPVSAVEGDMGFNASLRQKAP